MKLAAVVMIVGSAALANATTFDEYSHNLAPRPASQLYEASCDVEVELHGAVAAIELRQRFVNSGAQAMAGLYELELPKGAVVTGLAVGAEKALVVPAGFKSAEVESPDVLGADPAELHRTADGRHEIVLQPIEPGHDALVTTKYTALAVPRAGAFRLVMPGRASTGKLASCKGVIRVTPGPGAAVSRIRVNNVAVGTRSSAPFAIDTADVALDVDLDVAGSVPVVWTQTQPLADGWSASLLTVLAPRVKAAGARRVVFVVDGSRSMDLVGRHNVGRVVHALGSALPAGAEVEAIIYDRNAARVFGDVRPATPQNLALIEDTIAKRGSANGSDIVKAFELATQAIAGARGQAMVIVVTDGVTGDLADNALIGALASKTSAVDVHAIVLDPAHTRSPGSKVLRAPVNLYGGAYVEVGVDELDDALVAIDEWMRPSWLELAIAGHHIPTEVRSGSGFTHLMFHKPGGALTLTGHGDAKISVAARPGPAAPIAELALALATGGDFTGAADPNDVELAAGAKVLEHAVATHAAVDGDRALAVLATTGRIAKNRRAMIAGGGRYERMVALADPQRTAPARGRPGADPCVVDRADHARADLPRSAPAAGVRVLPARARHQPQARRHRALRAPHGPRRDHRGRPHRHRRRRLRRLPARRRLRDDAAAARLHRQRRRPDARELSAHLQPRRRPSDRGARRCRLELADRHRCGPGRRARQARQGQGRRAHAARQPPSGKTLEAIRPTGLGIRRRRRRRRRRIPDLGRAEQSPDLKPSQNNLRIRNRISPTPTPTPDSGSTALGPDREPAHRPG